MFVHRISDIKTQKDLCVFTCSPWNTISEVRINSKYLIVSSNERGYVAFRVFDLVAAKDPNNRKDLLITTFKASVDAV